MSQLLTPEECVLVLCYRSDEAYIKLLRGGLRAEYFNPKLLPYYTKIVEYRIHNTCKEIPINCYEGTHEEHKYLLNLMEAATEQRVWDWDAEKYLVLIKNEYNKRSVGRIIKGLKNYSYDEIVNVCTQMVNAVDGNNTNIMDLEGIIKELSELFEERQSPSYDNPYRTGIHKYDALGHYEPGSLIVLGGSSGHGKTTLALNMVYRWARHNIKSMYFSYEMTPAVIAAKLTCIHTQIPWDQAMNIRGQGLSEAHQVKYKTGMQELKKMPIVINDRLQQLPEIKYTIDAIKPRVFVIDTINHLIDQADKDKFWIFLGHVARELKEIAKKHKIIGIVVAQLREYIGRPTSKYFIAESKQLVNTADYMDFIFRAREHNLLDCPDELKEVLEVYRVKGRLTGIGSAFLHIDDPTGFVRNLSINEEDSVMEALKSHVKLLLRRNRG